MHENTREWHSSQSTPSVTQHLRVKRPLSTGDRDLSIGRIDGRNRSKSIHSTHESVIRYQGLAESHIRSNNNNNFNNNSNNTNSGISIANNDCINSQTSASNINYLYRNCNECTTASNIDKFMSTSGIDISPTFDLNTNNNELNNLSHMPSVGEYLSSASNSCCPALNVTNVKHNYIRINNLKSTIATNTITSTNRESRKFRSSSPSPSSHANHSSFDGDYYTNNITVSNSNKQMCTARAQHLTTSSDEMTTNSNCFIKSTSILKQLLKSKVTTTPALNPTESIGNTASHSIPTKAEKAQFRRSLDSATNLVFHRRNGLPLTSSPAPMRKSGTCFDFDSSLTSVNAIKKALFEKDPDVDVEIEKQKSLSLSTSAPASTTISSLLGNFEESVLNGRLEPASTVHGFTAEIGASGSFCPRHKTLPVTVFFYTLQDTDKADKVSSPYLGHINLGKKGYHIPRKGTVQATLFNPHGTVVKMFVVRYDLSDMPPNSQTFLRQRTLFMPSDANENDADNRKWLRYLIHLRFESSKSGRIYLHTDVRIIVFRKHDLDVATINGQRPYELRSFTQCPVNPKYS